MHDFAQLIDGCAAFTLDALANANNRTIQELQTGSAGSLVRVVQMIQLQKVVLAVGMFSIFEARLQEGLECNDGFAEAKRILDDQRELELRERFTDLYFAINTLKHGRGASYEALAAKAESLPFKVRVPGAAFFDEGDLAEVSTLIHVDDVFVRHCGLVIREMSELLRRVRPEFS